MTELAVPYLLLLGVVALVAVGLFLARKTSLVGGAGLAAVLVLVSAFAIQGVGARHGPTIAQAIDGGWRITPTAEQARTGIAPGARAAARWLRDHSGPDDIVATNVHCRSGPTKPRCETRHFWVSAYTERRVLLEGWSYTGSSHAEAKRTGIPHAQVAFWDMQRFADNEAAFQGPSVASIGRLRDAYGVRWLFVDTRFDPPPPTLADFAAQRFQAGDFEVYELT